jgi:dipeptidase E
VIQGPDLDVAVRLAAKAASRAYRSKYEAIAQAHKDGWARVVVAVVALTRKSLLAFFDVTEEDIMRLLLTSAGVKNPSIHNALVDLLDKPIAESKALCIPTAQYGHPNIGPGEGPWRFISGQSALPMCGLGWKSLGVLELTALPSIDEEHWVPKVRETDVLLVSGGDALYLCHWMRESGFADLVPELGETVYVGLSAGSMVMTPRIGEDFVGWKPPAGGDDSTLGVVDFSIFPHLDCEDLPENTMADAERWAADIHGPAYAIDDQTAITVTDGTVEVVSEGHWKLFSP